MNSALRVTLTCFNMFSLQKWLHVIAALFLVVALIVGFTAGPGNSSAAGPIGLAAAALVLLIPAYGGGNALRYLLSRNATQLWPSGRERIVAGATLTITLLACMATLPTVIAHIAESFGARDDLARTAPATVFAAAWASIAALWIFGYATSASPRTYFLIFLVPMVASRFMRSIAPLLPSASTSLAIAAACWLAFVIWILCAGTIRMPTLQQRSNSINYELLSFGSVSRDTAMRQLLLGTSTWWTYTVVGVGMLLVVTMICVMAFYKEGSHAGLDVPLPFLGVFSCLGGAIAFSLVRRSRLLWLRAGTNRQQLFRVSEYYGLLASLIAVGVLAAGLAIWSMALRPDLFSSILLNAMCCLSFSVAMFYVALGFTRGMNPADILIGALACVAIAMQMVAMRPSIDTLHRSWTMLVILVALIPILRWRALRRWRNLDWRIAGPPLSALRTRK